LDTLGDEAQVGGRAQQPPSFDECSPLRLFRRIVGELFG